MRPAFSVLLAGLLVAGNLAVADEDKDLDLVPEALPQPGAATGDAIGWKVYVEQALTLQSFRGDPIVPPPPQRQLHWRERLSLDAKRTWLLGPDLNASYSGRLNFLAEEDGPFPTSDNYRHDFREGFASWEAAPQDYLDGGRINLRSGVAAGFNPTDFFKTRAVVDRVSNDPSVLRENRLGALMVRGQSIGESGAVSLAYAPSVTGPTPVYGSSLPSLDPMFDRTNADHRVLLKASRDFGEDFSPELLVYREADRTRFGANLTRDLGAKVVGYVEWAGGRRASLIEEAFRYGQKTGTLPENAPRVLPGNRGQRFYNDAAIGAAYTTESKIAFNVEYHFHEAGLTRQDWRNWFDIGRAGAGSPAVAGQLWFLRAYALEQQEPLARHAAFVRADWTDALVPDLRLTGLANVNLYDGSTLAQLAADYFWSDRWTFGVLAAANLGDHASERGSQPLAASLLLKAICYF